MKLDISWMITAIIFMISAFAYARMIVTHELDLQHLQRYGYSSGSFDQLENSGPASNLDARVLALVLLITLPILSAPWLVGTGLHDFLIWLGIGALMSPLAIPSTLTPNRDDLNDPVVAFGKWIGAKIDVWVKTLLAAAVITAISYISFIGELLSSYSQAAFPVIQNKSASGFFEDMINGSLILMSLMFLWKWLQTYTHGVFFLAMSAFGIVYTWVAYQYFVNESFIPYGANPDSISVSFMAVFLALTVIDIMGLITPAKDYRNLI